MVSVSKAFKLWINALWSRVRGHYKKAFPANAMRPSRRPANDLARSVMANFVRSRRLGLMSSASILLETSTALLLFVPPLGRRESESDESDGA